MCLVMILVIHSFVYFYVMLRIALDELTWNWIGTAITEPVQQANIYIDINKTIRSKYLIKAPLELCYTCNVFFSKTPCYETANNFCCVAFLFFFFLRESLQWRINKHEIYLMFTNAMNILQRNEKKFEFQTWNDFATFFSVSTAPNDDKFRLKSYQFWVWVNQWQSHFLLFYRICLLCVAWLIFFFFFLNFAIGF